MSQTFVTGALGSGKTLYVMQRIREALWGGRKIATNIDIDLAHMMGPWNKDAQVFRLPDHPTIEDLENLPYGGKNEEIYEDSELGEIWLDECGTFLNSRTSMDPEKKQARLDLIDWMIHARKQGWSCGFLVQSYTMVDKQIREGLLEHLVVCKRLDRVNIPIISGVANAVLPEGAMKIHSAAKYYAATSTENPEKGMYVDTERYKATDLYGAYDTKQIFNSRWKYELEPEHLIEKGKKKPNEQFSTSPVNGEPNKPKMGHEDGNFGTYQLVPPFYYKGRQLGPSKVAEIAKTRAKEGVKKVASIASMCALIVLGFTAGTVTSTTATEVNKAVEESTETEQAEKPKKIKKTIDFTNFYIESHYRFGRKVFMTIADGDEETSQRYTTIELNDLGYFVLMPTECKLQILNEDTGIGYEIYCKKPEVKYLDPYDFSHLPTGDSLG